MALCYYDVGQFIYQQLTTTANSQSHQYPQQLIANNIQCKLSNKIQYANANASKSSENINKYDLLDANS